MNEALRRILFLPIQASTVAQEIDTLHYFVIIMTMAGATLVTVVGGIFLIIYRRRDGDLRHPHPDARAKPPQIIKIAALVLLVVLFLVWWIIGVQQYTTLRVSPPGAMEVYVTAKQWMWKFAYPQGARSIGVLYVPAGRPVRLIMTSRDVIHSFFVPDFRVKQDVIPGRYVTAWFQAKVPGTYEILCTEYCGANHSVMRAEVVALDPGDFARWLEQGERPSMPRIAGQQYAPPSIVGQMAPPQELGLVRLGEESASRHGCLRCHTTDGSPHIGPTWAGLYGSRVPLEAGAEVLGDEAYITESIMDPRAKVHRGFQPVMPSFFGRIPVGELAAIVEYIKSLRDVVPEPGARTPGWLLPDAGTEGGQLP